MQIGHLKRGGRGKGGGLPSCPTHLHCRWRGHLLSLADGAEEAAMALLVGGALVVGAGTVAAAGAGAAAAGGAAYWKRRQDKKKRKKKLRQLKLALFGTELRALHPKHLTTSGIPKVLETSCSQLEYKGAPPAHSSATLALHVLHSTALHPHGRPGPSLPLSLPWPPHPIDWWPISGGAAAVRRVLTAVPRRWARER